jgi:cyclophilin family peptidyl-prolyl cis-trans isomerase
MRAGRRGCALAALLALQLACASDPAPGTGSVRSALAAVDALIAAHPVDTASSDWKLHLRRPPVFPFPRDRSYFWMLFTNFGRMRIELLPESAPMHVGTTLYLTRLGFYDGLSFHRVIPKFMAQGGDPTGTGKGGPGFRYAGEFPTRNVPKHDERGVVSTANAGPRTDGSQFFILFQAAPHLDGKHTIFGRVVEGFGTLRLIEALGSEDGTPREPVVIERAEIREEMDVGAGP